MRRRSFVQIICDRKETTYQYNKQQKGGWKTETFFGVIPFSISFRISRETNGRFSAIPSSASSHNDYLSLIQQLLILQYKHTRVYSVPLPCQNRFFIKISAPSLDNSTDAYFRASAIRYILSTVSPLEFSLVDNIK